jgi:tetratricopeptide (TPR) repeat protein
LESETPGGQSPGYAYITQQSWNLERQEKLLGVDHPDTLGSVYNLALTFSSQGQYDQAEVLHQRALTGRERLLGADHPHTLNSVDGLGFIYYSQGRYNEAEAFGQRALVGREKRLGAGHPDTLRSMNNLGNVYRAQGRHGEAAALYQRSLETSGEHNHDFNWNGGMIAGVHGQL